MPTKSNFISMTFSDALDTIAAYESHRDTGHSNMPAGFKCPNDLIIETLLAQDWPKDEPESYFHGLFDMITACNLMWDEALKQNPLLAVLSRDVDHNLMGMMAVVAMKWKEAREKEGLEEVKEFSGMTEIAYE